MDNIFLKAESYNYTDEHGTATRTISRLFSIFR